MSATRSNVWKWWLGGAVGLLILIDAVLIFVLWQSAQAGPEAMRAERGRLQTEAKLYKADVDRAQAIRDRLGSVGSECDHFYEQTFPPAATGYSDVLNDLGTIASKAGLRTSQISFKQKDVKERGVLEIGITADVEGDYPAIIQFIKGLEQSKDFYLMDNLKLSSQTANNIRLNLALRTFFRS